MKTMVHCPSCSARLKASKDVAGRTIKCPKCQKPFKVPEDEKELVEETISCWLEEDHEKAQQTSEPAMPAKLEEHLPDYLPTHDSSNLDLAPPEPPPAKGAGDEGDYIGEQQPFTSDPTLDDAGAGGSASGSDPSEPHPPPSTDTHVDVPIALTVLEADATGGMIDFDSRLLTRWSFRASIPMRCCGCGENDPELLVAHPIIWLDRLADPKISPAYLAGKYERAVDKRIDSLQVLESLAAVREMVVPFRDPMPFYLCPDCGPKVHVEAETKPADAGATRCVVYIPSAQVLLEWLGRVNGVCGDDYLALRAATLGQAPVESKPAAPAPTNDAFTQLPQAIRAHVSEWYKPAGSEKFILFAKDLDYASNDAGRGGVVLTDHRLAYNKYHKHGSILLNDETTKLLAVRYGAIDELVVDTDGMRSKLVKLRHTDSERLGEALEELPCRLKLDMTEPEPDPADSSPAATKSTA